MRRRSYFYRGIMERLSKLVCENLMSGLWEGLWERIMMEDWEEKEEEKRREQRNMRLPVTRNS